MPTAVYLQSAIDGVVVRRSSVRFSARPTTRREVLAGLSLLPAALISCTAASSNTLEEAQDFTQRWSDAIARSARDGSEVVLPAGRFLIAAPPGSVILGEGPVAGVRSRRIRIRGAGAGRTILVAAPRSTAEVPAIEVSGTILRSFGAELVELIGLTFDGGIKALPESLRKGAMPDAVSMVEIRGALRVLLQDVAFTGFAGHWNAETPQRDSGGSRGPLLIADCTEVVATDLALNAPTFREGLFFHSTGSLSLTGFTYRGPDRGRGVSTPLHILGGGTKRAVLKAVRASGDWGGSLINLAGEGDLTIEDVIAEGPSAARAARAQARNCGIDFGGEINEANLGQRDTRSIKLINISLTNIGRYALQGSRNATCPLRRLELRDIRIKASGRALLLASVDMVAGKVTAQEVGMTAVKGRPIPAAVQIIDCGTGRLDLNLSGSQLVPMTGIFRSRSSGVVLGGRISEFSEGLMRDDVRLGVDGKHDARFAHMNFVGGSVTIGSGEKRRVRLARFDNCMRNNRPLDLLGIEELYAADVEFE